jgi:DNA-binding Xre family transcriptional regulator
MLSINLTPIFKARGIERPYSFLVNAGFNAHTAHSLLAGTTRAFKLDHIELLCKSLICEPNDLLAFTPNKNEVYLPEHPLLKLKQEDDAGNWTQTLATLPYKQLKKISQQINKGDAEEK